MYTNMNCFRIRPHELVYGKVVISKSPKKARNLLVVSKKGFRGHNQGQGPGSQWQLHAGQVKRISSCQRT